MLQLNGIVGGNAPISVGAGKTILLQQILIRVKNKQKLILRNINFLFNNDAFAIKIEAEPSPGTFIARGGAGDLSPNKVLVNNTTGEDLLIFLLVSAVNKAKNSRALSRSDSWRMTLVRR
ncbi:hypothetical protein SAMN04487897_12068 [Paenibacillus sp. yr247]|uniref:hypothetical protein n=1 Tax=Paenibacillus sp. yr247 TaxID=1761880 RepID=UPI0008854142|nr:hypothetical protein [Paenibacillus sp. yr247]SDO72368.1 hypothetical protein SAMN04487897_12068 [Paenibacillus sp. yr247]